MNHMFGGCKSLESLDLSSFNTCNVTDTNCMFLLCESLKLEKIKINEKEKKILDEFKESN